MSEQVRGELWCYSGPQESPGRSAANFTKLPLAFEVPQRGGKVLDLQCQRCGKPIRVCVRSRGQVVFNLRLRTVWATLLAVFGAGLLVFYFLSDNSPGAQGLLYIGGACLLAGACLMPYTIARSRRLRFTDHVFMLSGEGRTVFHTGSTPWKEHELFD